MLRRSAFSETRAPSRSKKSFLESQSRHLDPGWYEWTMREFVRYFYALGVLVLILMAPLQMVDSWLPAGGPPVVDPVVIGAASVAFAIVVGYASWRAYRFLWREGGYVDQAVERRAASDPSGTVRDPPNRG